MARQEMLAPVDEVICPLRINTAVSASLHQQQGGAMQTRGRQQQAASSSAAVASTSTSAQYTSTSDPFAVLPQELLDEIVTHVSSGLSGAHGSSLSRRRLVARSLGCSKALLAPMRRVLFHAIKVHVSKLPAALKDNARLMALLDGEQGRAHRGRFVRSLALDCPVAEPDWSKLEQARDNPASILLPPSGFGYLEALQLAIDVLRQCPNVHDLRLESRVGTWELTLADDIVLGWDVDEAKEGTREATEAQHAARDELIKLLEAQSAMKSFTVNVEHPEKSLQLLAARGGYVSPYACAMVSWHALTRLDLWRVHLDTQDVAGGGGAGGAPTFALELCALRECSIASEQDLLWLFGEPGGRRSAKLRHIEVDSLEVDGNPLAAPDALLALFPQDRAPSFAHTLESLELHVRTPFQADVSRFFEPFTNLRSVLLFHAGITRELYFSLLRSPSLGTIRQLYHHVLFSLHPDDLCEFFMSAATLDDSAGSAGGDEQGERRRQQGKPFHRLRKLGFAFSGTHTRTTTWVDERMLGALRWEWPDECVARAFFSPLHTDPPYAGLCSRCTARGERCEPSCEKLCRASASSSKTQSASRTTRRRTRTTVARRRTGTPCSSRPTRMARKAGTPYCLRVKTARLLLARPGVLPRAQADTYMRGPDVISCCAWPAPTPALWPRYPLDTMAPAETGELPSKGIRIAQICFGVLFTYALTLRARWRCYR